MSKIMSKNGNGNGIEGNKTAKGNTIVLDKIVEKHIGVVDNNLLAEIKKNKEVVVKALKEETTQRAMVVIWKSNAKTCSICGKRTDFNKTNNNLSNRQTHCKLCDAKILIEKLNSEIEVLKTEIRILKEAKK